MQRRVLALLACLLLAACDASDGVPSGPTAMSAQTAMSVPTAVSAPAISSAPSAFTASSAPGASPSVPASPSHSPAVDPRVAACGTDPASATAIVALAQGFNARRVLPSLGFSPAVDAIGGPPEPEVLAATIPVSRGSRQRRV